MDAFAHNLVQSLWSQQFAPWSTSLAPLQWGAGDLSFGHSGSSSVLGVKKTRLSCWVLIGLSQVSSASLSHFGQPLVHSYSLIPGNGWVLSIATWFYLHNCLLRQALFRHSLLRLRTLRCHGRLFHSVCCCCISWNFHCLGAKKKWKTVDWLGSKLAKVSLESFPWIRETFGLLLFWNVNQKFPYWKFPSEVSLGNFFQFFPIYWSWFAIRIVPLKFVINKTKIL